MNALSDLGALIVTDRQAMSMSPATPAARTGGDVSLDQAANPGPGAWRDPPHAEQARFGLSQAFPAVVQRNGDLIRLAPDGPEENRRGAGRRLVLDGDVILSADGSTINERRKISVNGLITVACPSMARGRWPARQWFVPSACRSSKIATISWPTRPMPPSVLIGRLAISRRFVAVRLAVRRCATLCGPARSRWSK